MIAQEFECPGCGAPLDPSGGEAQLICPYCGKHVIVPPDLRPARAPAAPTVLVQTAYAPVASYAPPAPTVRVSRGGCARVLVVVVLLLVIVPMVIGAAAWISLGRPVQSLIPTNFADPVLTFGAKGSAPGQMHDPRALAVDGAGNVYVLDRNPGAVHKFDAQGRFLLRWDLDAKYPDSLAADHEGNVYVVQDGAIWKYAGATGARLTSLLPGDSFGMNRFQSVAALPDGGLLTALAPSFTDVARLNAQGQVVQRWKEMLKGHTDEVDIDLGLAADPAGNLYVLGTSSAAVFKFGPDGRFVTQIGSKGEGRDQLEWPAYAVAVDSRSRVYVSSSFNGVQVYDGAGGYLGRIGLPVRATVNALAVDAHDNLYALAGNDARIYKFALPTPAPTPTP